jgi:flagella basal body P-ring formation protein FlgA
MMRHTHVILMSALLAALCSGAFADTIALKTSARLGPNASAVTLADVAVLEGPDALRLADVQVANTSSNGAVVEIDIASVRKALDAAGVNWAKVNLSGAKVVVRPMRDPSVAPPQAMAPAAIGDDVIGDAAAGGDAPHTFALDAIAGEDTIHGAIARLIVTGLRVDARDVRVRFSDRHADVLSAPLASGRFEIQPLGSLAGDRLEFAVRGWEGSRAAHVGQITLVAERRVNVTRAHRDLPRDRALIEDDLETAESWLPPSEAMMIAPRVSAIGRVLDRAIKAGDVIRLRDLQRETLINRGDLVTVRCLVGGVAISLQAEAKADGSQGEAIEFRKSGERDTFLATVTGRNEAVVDLARQ